METLQLRMTGIVGAEVLVIAIEGLFEDTDAVDAVVPGSALVGIVARPLLGLVETALRRVAGIPGTGITVLTVHRLSPQAHPVHTLVSGSAGIAITAGSCERLVEAALLGIAKVLGALQAVVAVGRVSGRTGSFLTLVVDGAGIAIRAAPPFVGGSGAALTSGGLTERGQAWCVEPLECGADHHAVRNHRAQMGQLVGVAEESPIAQVAVLQGGAVPVLLALAIHGEPHTAT